MGAVAPLVVPGVTMSLPRRSSTSFSPPARNAPPFPTRVFIGLNDESFDSHRETGRDPIPADTSSSKTAAGGASARSPTS